MKIPKTIPAVSAPIPALNARECPAKTFLSGDTLLPGRSVFEHCLIVGHVAQALIATFPVPLRSALFPAGCSLVAACHDIGKLSPLFYLRLHLALQWPASLLTQSLLRSLGLTAQASALRELEQSWGGHAGAGASAIQAITRRGELSTVIGQHHGLRTFNASMTASDDMLGGVTWQAARQQLVEELQQALNETWPEALSFSQQLSLAGLTTVADWIGSGPRFTDPLKDWRAQLPLALTDANMSMPAIRPGLSFGEQFVGYQPNEAQLALFEAVKGPGVYVLEAPMGMGKTEAALYAAYRVLAAGEARGVYFALPTQLTSNKIYQRFSNWLQNIIEPGSAWQKTLLLHGSAHLQEGIGEDAQPGGSWFNSRKRGLLAPFAVGTLDQALMAAMNVKHGFVRTFGLAGKVVVVDEVHSFDPYTGLILQQLVEVLRDLHCTVIILSATLTGSRRDVLFTGKVEGGDGYPLITYQPQGATVAQTRRLLSPTNRNVSLKFSQDEDALEEALLRAEQGQQVLWIENTVDAAQACYATLASRGSDMGIASGLLHSRYVQRDRTAHEERWVNRYGKEGWQVRQQGGAVLVGTQVLEQSIDIDADFLVTRMAPTDLLMQRLGRLWRHQQTPRPDAARCEAWLLTPTLESALASPYQAFGASAWVYAPYILCRSLEVWHDKTSVALPTDIRPVLEATYVEREEREPLSLWRHELLEGKRTSPTRPGINELQQQARLTLSMVGATQPESKARTRYSEQDNNSFLLLRAALRDEKNNTLNLQLLTGEWLIIPRQKSRMTESERRQYSLKLEKEKVSLPPSRTPEGEDGQWLWKWGLQHLLYAGNSAEREMPEVRIVIVEPSGDVRGVDGAFRNTRYRYRYQDKTGLRIEKKES